jgi:hypothetical protein
VREEKMGLLDDILGKIVDIKLKLKAGKMGIINIETTKNIYNVNVTFAGPEASKPFADAFAAGNQTKLIENAEKLLSANSSTLKVLRESTAIEFANATIVASAAAASGVEGKVKIEETIRIGESATVRLTPEEESKK